MKNLNLYQDGITSESKNRSIIDCPFCLEKEGASYKAYSQFIQCDFKSRIVRPSGLSDVLVFPDLSPLKRGHVLISTCEHIGNFSEVKNLSTIGNFEKVVNDISKKLPEGNELFYFEHGTSSCISKSGCVQHAHIHAIPVRCGVYENVLNCAYDYGDVSRCEFEDFYTLHSSIHGETDSEHYVLFGRCNDSGGIRARYITADFVPSQLMRYVLSQVLHLPMHIEDISKRNDEFRKTMNYLESCLC